MALFFGKKKDEDAGKAPGSPTPAAASAPGPAPDSGEYAPSPEKAQRFFMHAKTVDEAGNFEYAMQCWLNGLRFDPHNMGALEGFFASVAKFLSDAASKKGPSKELMRSVSGKGDIDRYLLSILEWGLRPAEAELAVRAMESAVKMSLSEPTVWIGERAYGAALREKRDKLRKQMLLKVGEAFGKVGVFDKAVAALEGALKADPGDGDLAAYIRQMAANATMARGGYGTTTAEAGSFRRNIKDADAQRQLQEGERIAKTEESIDRLITAAAADYKERPGDLQVAEKLGRLLLERGKPQDQETAYQLFVQTYGQSKQFRFRELAGDIKIRQARRKVTELKDMLEKAPSEEMIQRMLAQATDEFNAVEVAEYELRVENYPTDLARKFELAKRYFNTAKYDKAIELLQEVQHDPRSRVSALSHLAQSFFHLQMFDESIEIFRRALDISEISNDTLLDMRYGLMQALEARAGESRDLAAADEASKLAASIAAQQFSYRDIRARREAIKKLLTDLRGGA